jgi:hypothetical protein
MPSSAELDYWIEQEDIDEKMAMGNKRQMREAAERQEELDRERDRSLG